MIAREAKKGKRVGLSCENTVFCMLFFKIKKDDGIRLLAGCCTVGGYIYYVIVICVCVWSWRMCTRGRAGNVVY